jgi:A/G-specific adenine glycosylase
MPPGLPGTPSGNSTTRTTPRFEAYAAVPESRIAAAIESWFDRHRRALPWRQHYPPYHVWISEVMLQQTRMEVALEYFPRFLERFPTIALLAAATEADVLAAWSGLGYYRRARMLRDGAREVIERFGGTLPAGVAELSTIPGIGRYTAGAIASIAYQQRAAIVDGNVARICARVYEIEEALGSPALMREAWLAAEALVTVSDDPRMLNQGLMELGALICKPRNPACLLCPVRDDCGAARHGRVEQLPLPKVKQATRELRIPLYIIRDAAGRLLMRRERGALMNAMYHLPHGNSALFDEPPIDVTLLSNAGTVRHTVTNRRIEFEVQLAALPAHASAIRDGGDYVWIEEEELPRVPHPSYVRKALSLVAALAHSHRAR